MHFVRFALPVLLATLASGVNAAGSTAPADAFHRILTPKLEAELQKISQEFGGVYGAQVIDLTDGTRFGVNADLVFPQASAIKVVILVELFRQAEAKPALLRSGLQARPRHPRVVAPIARRPAGGGAE
jgi:beta-lactamase class A